MIGPDTLKKTAKLGNNVYAPWPFLELNQAADRIEKLEEALKKSLPLVTLHDGELSEHIGKLLKGVE